jgi:hypothetical protein
LPTRRGEEGMFVIYAKSPDGESRPEGRATALDAWCAKPY